MKIVSSISTAAIAISVATPTFAFTIRDAGTGRSITSRQVVRNFNARPILGNRNRSTAVADTTGRILLPLRNTWRHAGLRNVNRHLLGRRRGGNWGNTRHYTQGDVRRSSRVAAGAELLPPSIVQTGIDAGRPSRRAIRGNRDLNNYNRR